MKRVYVAGAFSADNVIDVLKNIGRGQEYAARIFNMGFAPFCPWLDKEFVIRFWEEEYTTERFYEYSMAWLEVSDIVFVVPGWEESAGTKREIEEAIKLKIPLVINDLKILEGMK